jgi:hypothetical protein
MALLRPYTLLTKYLPQGEIVTNSHVSHVYASPLSLCHIIVMYCLRRVPLAFRRANPKTKLLLPLERGLATPASPPSPNDPFANSSNAHYAEAMYKHWRQNPNSVHASWNAYFSGLDKGLPSFQAFQPPPKYLPAAADGAPALHAGGGAELDDHLKVSCFQNVFLLCFLVSYCLYQGSTTCSSIPSTRSSCRGIGSSRDSRCRPR